MPILSWHSNVSCESFVILMEDTHIKDPFGNDFGVLFAKCSASVFSSSFKDEVIKRLFLLHMAFAVLSSCFSKESKKSFAYFLHNLLLGNNLLMFSLKLCVFFFFFSALFHIPCNASEVWLGIIEVTAQNIGTRNKRCVLLSTFFFFWQWSTYLSDLQSWLEKRVNSLHSPSSVPAVSKYTWVKFLGSLNPVRRIPCGFLGETVLPKKKKKLR